MAYRRGDASTRRIDYSRYVVPEQTNRGVGPGIGLVTTVTQIHVTGVDPAEPPPQKRAETEKEERPGCARYCVRVSQNTPFLLCEGLLG
eukprot:14958595-Alexandrium_andersonii.AAC.1